MKIIFETDDYAVNPYYYTNKSMAHAPKIKDLLTEKPSFTLNKQAILQYLNKQADDRQTCFSDINKLPPAHILYADKKQLSTRAVVRENDDITDIKALLIEVLNSYACKDNIALALSGGLDSALILALLKEAGINNISVYTLATAMPGYCELEKTQRTARYFGVKLNIVYANSDDFIHALPETIHRCETPLYNLHPVSKLLLARAVKADGFNHLLTGDAADQAFSGAESNNYLPIVGAIIKQQQLNYLSPFFNPQVVMAGRKVMDKNKSALRFLSQNLLPAFLVKQKKQPTYAPDFDLSKYWQRSTLQSISDELNISANIRNTTDKNLWTTLALLISGMR